ncbi:MAG: BrnA antitoxin family protein [Candidatus Marithrix sp.]
MTNIVKYSTEELKNLEENGGDQTDWQHVHLMKDEDIEYDEDSPKITEEMFSKATTQITLSLDSDVIEWYTKQNIAYQSLVNKLLRSYMESYN